MSNILTKKIITEAIKSYEPRFLETGKPDSDGHISACPICGHGHLAHKPDERDIELLAEHIYNMLMRERRAK